MKIISWNIGNFIWLRHLPNRAHYSFQRSDAHVVFPILKKENADVLFLQEIEEEDIDFVKDHLKVFTYFFIIHTDDRPSVSLFLSKFPIEEIKHTNSNDYIIEGITFFPIHLNAFSPKRRHEQTLKLQKDLPKTSGIILGDTNFWIYHDHFLSKKDKKSYTSIVKDHQDILKGLGHTCRINLALDKMFITNDLNCSFATITRHAIGHIDHYMIQAVVHSTVPHTTTA